MLLCALPSPAQVPREYQLKAAFLFRFTQFVEWPPSAFATPQSPIVIGVLGESPFGTTLDVARKQRVNNRPVTVEYYQRVDQIKVCHVLFISASEDAQLEKILADLKGRSILFVGETEGFARRGGMVRFLTEQNRIRFVVNSQAARAAGLQISSRLLALAEVITAQKE